MAAENAYNYGYAPAYAPERKPEAQPERKKETQVKKVRKTEQEARIYEERIGNRKSVKVFALIAVAFLLFAGAGHSKAMRDEAKRDLEQIKEEYVYVEACNRELKVQLNKIINAENIDQIAVEKLGLVKVAPGNEIYLDGDAENKVIYSKGK